MGYYIVKREFSKTPPNHGPTSVLCSSTSVVRERKQCRRVSRTAVNIF